MQQLLPEWYERDYHYRYKHDDAGDEEVGVQHLQLLQGFDRSADKHVGNLGQAIVKVVGSHAPRVLVTACV